MPNSDPRFEGSKFSLGRIVKTSNIQASVSDEAILLALKRHVVGDWGDVGEEDRQSNEDALKNGDRLVSIYHSESGVKFYIITEWDRSVSTALLPEDY
jgi:hypothetical protein